jgi:RNase P/RNase MRP subunit POP5
MIIALNDNVRLFFKETNTPNWLRLIRFDGTVGILKCPLDRKKTVSDMLKTIHHIALQPVQIETIAMSGTIHALLKNSKMSQKNRTDSSI